MFKKLMVVWMTLALIVALALPASASINPITGHVRVRINGFNLSDGGVLDFEGRTYLSLSGSVNDFTTWKAAFYTSWGDFSSWSGTSLITDYAFAIIAPPSIPIKLEVGKISASVYGVTAYYGDALGADSVVYSNGGVNIISDTLFPGLTSFLTLMPDVNSGTSGNQESALLGFNFAQTWGRIAGAAWTRKDKEGLGYRVAGLFNLVPNDLTLYVTVGQKAGSSELTHQIIGVNIPRLNTEIGLNPYIEYDIKNGCLGIYFSKTLTTNTALYVYIGQNNDPTSVNFKKWFITPYLNFSF